MVALDGFFHAVQIRPVRKRIRLFRPFRIPGKTPGGEQKKAMHRGSKTSLVRSLGFRLRFP